MNVLANQTPHKRRLGFSREVKNKRAVGGGDFLFIPCHNPEVKAFIPYKMHVYNIYRRVRCTNVDNYP